MKKENLKNLCVSIGLLAAFVLWTFLIQKVDLQAIGPRGSAVGFATLNQWVHDLTGVHMDLYILTDWLGLVPVFVGMGFAGLGLVQWIKRKYIWKVDYTILVLGGFYIATMAAYIFFESYVVNYRPVLINGYLEASYPSSTTLLVTCVMPTAIMQFNGRIKNALLKKWVTGAIVVFVAFMVVGRLISGVHWFSDIIGGLLLSAGLVMAYRFVVGLKR